MKKFAVLLLCAATLICFAACGTPETGPEKVSIAVLAAMGMEAKQLEKLMDSARPVKSAGKKFTLGAIGGTEVILHQGGMGLEKAEAGTCALLENFQPDVLILFGMSGGIVPEIALYETVVASAVFPTWKDDWTSSETDEALQSLAIGLLDGARLAPIATGNKMTWRKSDYDRIANACGAVAVDQESYAVAETARKAGVPLLIIRSMSDIYENTSLLGFFKYGPVSAEKAAKDVETVILHLEELENTCPPSQS